MLWGADESPASGGDNFDSFGSLGDLTGDDGPVDGSIIDVVP